MWQEGASLFSYKIADGQRFKLITRFPALTWLWRPMTDPPVCASSPPQNGRLPCDADIERLTLNEGYINGAHHVSGFEARNYPCCCSRGTNSKHATKWDDRIFTLPSFTVQDGAWAGDGRVLHSRGRSSGAASCCLCRDQWRWHHTANRNHGTKIDSKKNWRMIFKKVTITF